MEKDFDRWNEEKKKIDKIPEGVFFRRREIWWCQVGLNVRYEQDGKGFAFERPVLILRKLGEYTFIGVPISTKDKEGFTYHKFLLPNGEWRLALIGHIRSFDSLRLTEYLDTVRPSEFFPIVKAVQNLIEPLPTRPAGFEPCGRGPALLELLPKADVEIAYQEYCKLAIY